jgi:hypothetical protein
MTNGYERNRPDVNDKQVITINVSSDSAPRPDGSPIIRFDFRSINPPCSIDK